MKTPAGYEIRVASTGDHAFVLVKDRAHWAPSVVLPREGVEHGVSGHGWRVDSVWAEGSPEVVARLEFLQREG